MADGQNIMPSIIEQGSPELVRQVTSAIAHSMAECLIENGIDLADRNQVVQTLHRYKYGPRSISACGPLAANIAQQWGQDRKLPGAAAVTSV
ncbi:hypothetical protein HFO09_14030 [Rhizobium laguerreae]|uniref:hypothetical protein n=1 Tax=Rhizobium laguerreae TaxID=1076926 RepID=UPI001C8FF9A2|nr:hypothetical protein [Rhizobium laguerreae]MBY3254526.1 hypothetical protein [Rhizobium laguerreae]MBY3283843.1 hypothetical protein [Rhizobium laguerreae]MBY3290185.1 hypothetical protein [Rhizobium laguerreae]